MGIQPAGSPVQPAIVGAFSRDSFAQGCRSGPARGPLLTSCQNSRSADWARNSLSDSRHSSWDVGCVQGNPGWSVENRLLEMPKYVSLPWSAGHVASRCPGLCQRAVFGPCRLRGMLLVGAHGRVALPSIGLVVVSVLVWLKAC